MQEQATGHHDHERLLPPLPPRIVNIYERRATVFTSNFDAMDGGGSWGCGLSLALQAGGSGARGVGGTQAWRLWRWGVRFDSLRGPRLR